MADTNTPGAVAKGPDPTPMEYQDGDNALAATQKTRVRIVNAMLKKGVPDDPKEVKVLLTALDGIDRQELTKKKIASDEGLGNKALEAAAMIATLFQDARTKSYNPAPVEFIEQVDRPPELDPSIQPTQVLPGELDGIGKLEDYNAFMKRVRGSTSQPEAPTT